MGFSALLYLAVSDGLFIFTLMVIIYSQQKSLLESSGYRYFFFNWMDYTVFFCLFIRLFLKPGKAVIKSGIKHSMSRRYRK